MSAARKNDPFNGEMAKLQESFIVEANEILEKLDQDLTELEKDPSNADLHNTIFRAVHTVKETSSFLGFQQLTELAHHFEDVLNKVRQGKLTVTAAMMDVVFEAFDLMKTLLRRIEGARMIKKRGGYIMAQEGDSCVVYGIPKAIVDDGLAGAVVWLDRIANALEQVGMKKCT